MLATNCSQGFVVGARHPHLTVIIYATDADYTPILIAWSVADMTLDGAITGLLWYYLNKVRRPPEPDVE